MRFQVSFRADLEAKKNLIHHFTSNREIPVIKTHDGIRIKVGENHQYAALILDVYTASTWPGVRATHIILENGE